jgi:hypothetical protein
MAETEDPKDPRARYWEGSVESNVLELKFSE